MVGVLQSEAPKIAKLVQITPITMVYGTYNELVIGAYRPINITGGPTLYILLRTSEETQVFLVITSISTFPWLISS